MIEIDALLETIPGAEQAVSRAAAAAEERCLISQALDVPVHVAVQVRPVGDSAVPEPAALR